jgi:predicted acylesterase/phospholipase RssA
MHKIPHGHPIRGRRAAILRALTLAAAIAPLAACVTTGGEWRPAAVRRCAFEQVSYPTGSNALASITGQSPSPSMRRMLTEVIAARDSGAPTSTNPLEWLALSGGGQWGAYGAGFLSGWSNAGDRPDFDVVTGVSTGAMMSVFAFLGPDYDDEMRAGYTITSPTQYVRKFGLLSLPRQNAVYDTGGLRQSVGGAITRLDLVTQVAAQAARGRKLMIGVVDADSAIFYAIDLTRLATLETMSLADKQQCMTDYIMASAAIPVVFPPVFIDGHMFVDGSARANAFVGDLTSVARTYGKRATNIYIVQNGALRMSARQVRNRLLPIAVRSAEIFVDSVSDASFIELLRQSRTSGVTRYVTADGTSCAADYSFSATAVFSPPFMACLLDHGLTRGRQTQGRWNPDTDAPAESVPADVKSGR